MLAGFRCWLDCVPLQRLKNRFPPPVYKLVNTLFQQYTYHVNHYLYALCELIFILCMSLYEISITTVKFVVEVEYDYRYRKDVIKWSIL